MQLLGIGLDELAARLDPYAESSDETGEDTS